MPLPQPSNGYNLAPILDSHEKRLLTLEELARSTSEQIAVSCTKIDFLSDKVDFGFQQLNQSVGQQTKAIEDKISTICDKVSSSDSRLVTIEKTHLEEDLTKKKKVSRQKAWRTALWAVFWASIGVAVKEGFPILMKILH